ncbi:MAG: F0F1 ATP synthase subunit delta [Chromatiaceae bacterium]|nr:F0F1 ATP synthase subunit delta [Gammaproteobacteria bacterium]MCB1880409.1 F0F1 ATP synthase subunit delta [Gammaproteobacteria bacterium]MCP5428038.1 F0F1 ATP synthase subunit delta [Chromatiaceae bacterium]MCP5447185.1 F0F1 ATP synthase subunit delta [Chromatiaceae bacterium]
MAGDTSTIARPYAEAVFSRASESGKLDSWTDQLSLLAGLVSDPSLHRIIADPLFGRVKLTELLIEICGEQLDEEGRNLLKLLVQNNRLPVVPEIVAAFQKLKDESQQVLKVHVTSAFVLKPAQEKNIADALKARFGREIIITSEKDPELIGGVHIRAGDTVIDGSVSGRLQQLANELGI